MKEDSGIGSANKSENAIALFHGTAQKFRRFKLGTGNAGPGVYLTNSHRVAEYYSCFATKRLAVKMNGIQAITSTRKIGEVLQVRLRPGVKIKRFEELPEFRWIDEARQAGYGGFSYPDEMVNSLGDWDRTVLGDYPAPSRATVVFNPDDACIIAA